MAFIFPSFLPSLSDFHLKFIRESRAGSSRVEVQLSTVPAVGTARAYPWNCRGVLEVYISLELPKCIRYIFPLSGASAVTRIFRIVFGGRQKAPTARETRGAPWPFSLLSPLPQLQQHRLARSGLKCGVKQLVPKER